MTGRCYTIAVILDGIPGYVSIEVAAARLGLELRQVQALCHTPYLTARRCGKRTLLVLEESLDEEVRRRETKCHEADRYFPHFT